jgi:ribosomal protein S27AE
MATFEQCQRKYDAQTPDEPDECPECGALIKLHVDQWRCEECTWVQDCLEPEEVEPYEE